MTVEKWGVLELTFHGRTDGNPFTDYELTAQFSHEKETVVVKGFYDGDGIYRLRFMPSYEGTYTYRVSGNCFTNDNSQALSEEKPGEACDKCDNSREGVFTVTPAGEGNHGPVRVWGEKHMAYADGTPYHSIGTTCYAWVNQTPELQQQTLKTLRENSFNKIRFCVFPKFYQYNEKEPLTYPYMRGMKRGQDPKKEKRDIEVGFYTEKTIADIRDFDCFTFNVEHFRRFDERIAELAELGIEADIILFHPYDKWGFATMSRECNELYLKYMAARYGAFRNVWWSMANEYDILNNWGWTNEEWSAYGKLITGEDPYHHLCSIHNCVAFFDYREPWITHCSMQRQDLYRHAEYTDEYLQEFQKPVVWDEIAYEGNIDQGWGNISGQEMVRRFWETVLRGGACGHGETFVHPKDILWWSHGGELHGESSPRFAFLKKVWDETPGGYLKRGGGSFDEVVGIPVQEEKMFDWGSQTWCSYEIHYYGFGRPSFRDFFFPEGVKFNIQIIDTWNMTIEDWGVGEGHVRVELPGREWMAIRLWATEPSPGPKRKDMTI